MNMGGVLIGLKELRFVGETDIYRNYKYLEYEVECDVCHEGTNICVSAE